VPESKKQRALNEGDVVDVRGRVRCVVDPGTGRLFVRIVVEDPDGGGGWTDFRVPIEAVRRAPA